jgi:hypothetical protein
MPLRKKIAPPPSRWSRIVGRVRRRPDPQPEPARSRAIVAWLTRGRIAG